MSGRASSGSPGGVARAAPRRVRAPRVPHRGRVGAQLREQRAEDAGAGHRVRQGAVSLPDLDPEVAASGRQPEPFGQRSEPPARSRPCRAPAGPASPGRSARRPARSTRASKRALWATSTRPLEQPGELGQDLLGRGRGVHHLLGDPGEALDPAPERPLYPHHRLPGVVQLPAADQHGADLRHLAPLPGRARWSRRPPRGTRYGRAASDAWQRRAGRIGENVALWASLRRASGGWPPRHVFNCSACGHESPKWHGRCPGCGEWEALVEEARRHRWQQAPAATAPRPPDRCRSRRSTPRPSRGWRPASESSTGFSAAAWCPARWC